MSKAFIKILRFLDNIDHLKKEQIDYYSHMTRALEISSRLLYASIALFIHAFFPNKFKYTGSSIITEEYLKLQAKKETV
jgi:hypothetical protein